MRFFNCFFLLFLTSFLIAAQSSDWQSDADHYLKICLDGDDLFEAPELQHTLSKKFELIAKKQRIELSMLHLLSIWGAENGLLDAPKFRQQMLNAYANRPYEQALFILDYAVSLPNNNQLSDFRTALGLLESIHKDSSKVYIHALQDYANRLLEHKDYSTSLATFERAIRLLENTDGKSNELYSQLLEDLARYYDAVGKIELSVEHRERAQKNTNAELGINQPVLWFLPLQTSPLDMLREKRSMVSDKMRLALLFRYSTTNVYRRQFATFLYEDIVPLMKERVSDDPLSLGYVMLQKGVLDYYLDHTGEAIVDFSKAVKVFNAQRPVWKTDDRFAYYDLLNMLACAEYAAGHYNLAQTRLLDLQREIAPFQDAFSRWYINLSHNLILTAEKIDDQVMLRKLLSVYISGNGSLTEFPTVSHLEKYGDISLKIGQYDWAYKFYDNTYQGYWQESERRLNKQREQEDGTLENDMRVMDDNQILVTIQPDHVVNEIYPHKPYGPEYASLLYKFAQAAFLTGNYTQAEKFVLQYVDEFYTQLDHAHQHLERGTDLYEIYRLKESLFPAYELFLNTLMMDTVSSELSNSNKMLSFTQTLDSKANLQYEYRHMRNVIENSKDEKLKNAYQLYLTNREKLGKLKLSGNENSEMIDALTIATDTLKAYLSSRTPIMTPIQEKFTFWESVRKALGRNEAAIEIKRFHQFEAGRFSDQGHYAVYIITPGSTFPQIVFLRNGAYLETKALKFYQNSIQQKLEDTRSYDTFWKPIQDRLPPGTYKVFLAPDGVYNRINVNTLYDSRAKKFLVDKLQLYQVVNTKDVHLRKDIYKKVQSAVLMGRPTYYIDELDGSEGMALLPTDSTRMLTRDQIASGNITDLPGTEREIRTIEKILKTTGVSTQYYVGDDATEEAFKQSASSGIIHLATHGFWFQEDDKALNTDDAMLNSGLLLAGVKNYYQGSRQQNEDGILTAYEVQGLNLNGTAVAILSACETGLGHSSTDEGVYGLQRAFHIAGVDKIIMSLWKVDDAATQELFTLLYERWVNKTALVEAFREAQLALRKKYDYPYYWGAFVLVD